MTFQFHAGVCDVIICGHLFTFPTARKTSELADEMAPPKIVTNSDRLMDRRRLLIINQNMAMFAEVFLNYFYQLCLVSYISVYPRKYDSLVRILIISPKKERFQFFSATQLTFINRHL